jgi:hypothetical protein
MFWTICSLKKSLKFKGVSAAWQLSSSENPQEDKQTINLTPLLFTLLHIEPPSYHGNGSCLAIIEAKHANTSQYHVV